MPSLYVIFVMTGEENYSELFVNKILQNYQVSVFVPIVEKYHRTASEITKQIKVMFPGYIFIESELNDMEIYKEMKIAITSCDDIISMLRYGDSFVYKLRDQEHTTIKALMNRNYCMEASIGIIIGDKVHITSGALVGFESIIKKINRHRREATIEIEMMGAMRQIVVGLDVIQRI